MYCGKTNEYLSPNTNVKGYWHNAWYVLVMGVIPGRSERSRPGWRRVTGG